MADPRVSLRHRAQAVRALLLARFVLWAARRWLTTREVVWLSARMGDLAGDKASGRD